MNNRGTPVVDCYLRDDLAGGSLAQGSDAGALLDWARSVAKDARPEEIYRAREGRQTLRFNHSGASWFLKLHSGIGWSEVIKNLLQMRLPIISASNEYRAVQLLRRIGVDTLAVAAYARVGKNPATVQSMIVCEDLVGTVSLEDFCADWASAPPDFVTRTRLVRKLAESARRMHEAGINHRDFYLCHFHLDPETLCQASPRCYLIDLHRAQLRRHTPRRWRVKDLAGLYFSAMDCGLQRRDLLRFMHYYTPGGLRRAMGADAALWRQVEERARRLYRKGYPAQVSSGGAANDR